jgi:hydrogenase-4 component E
MSGGPGVYEGAANAIAALMLLLEFGMLRQALLRDQVRLYAAQSALISVLAIVIAADRELPDLYAIAGLSAALKVIVVPYVLRRLLLGPLTGDWRTGDEMPGVAGSYTLNVASAVLASIALAAFGFFSLENAVSLAALVLAAGLPLILETAFLFDLLVAVVVFGMLIRAHHAKAESLSTADLTRLRG